VIDLPAVRDLELARRRWLQGVGALVAGVALPSRALHAAPASPGPSSATLRLSLNENPFGPSPLAIKAIQAGLEDLSRYTGAEAEALVSEIARRERVSVEQVIVGDVLEALGQELASQGGPSGEFVYSEPGYLGLVDAARAQGGVGVPVALDARLENDLAALERAVTARTRAVFLVNPHNPSGTVNDPAALRDFVRRVALRTTVIVDEAYLEFTPDMDARTAATELVAGARVVVFRTFTKFYGLAALPLSYAILPAELAAALRKKGLGAARSLNRLAVVAAAASLQDTVYAERVRRAVADERGRWVALLKPLGLRHSDARGNFIFFDSGKPQPELAAAFAARGIDIGRAFPPLLGWARISIGLPEQNARARAVLREAITR
jgi:histidinol-phosphate aminotransferase